MWQNLRDYRAGLPERLARWRQAELASQETLAQVEQHKPSSRDRRGSVTQEGSKAVDWITQAKATGYIRAVFIGNRVELHSSPRGLGGVLVVTEKCKRQSESTRKGGGIEISHGVEVRVY